MGGETVLPQNLRLGDGPCIRLPIFGEVVLLETCESTNRKKPIFLKCETDVYRQEKSEICYVIYQAVRSQTAETGKRQKKVVDD